jgi:hypothetical protein
MTKNQKSPAISAMEIITTWIALIAKDRQRETWGEIPKAIDDF